MNLALSDEQTAALLCELDRIIDGDRYPLSPRIRTSREIRAKIMPEPIREPMPPIKRYEPPSRVDTSDAGELAACRGCRGCRTALPCPWAPPVAGWPMASAEHRRPSVQLHYRAFIPTTSCSAPVLRFGTLVLAVCAAWTSPLASERQVLTFRTRAWLSFAPPTCRMPLGQASGSPELIPEEGAAHGFDIV